MTRPRGIVVLGATGSVGANTLDVLALHPDRYRLVALSGNRQLDRLFDQVLRFHPPYVVTGDVVSAEVLRKRLMEAGMDTEVLHGVTALAQMAALPEVDVVMAAIVGVAGLTSTMAAARAGKRILLANKESLVVAGRLFMNTVRHHGATLLPVDSEHSAIFQSLPCDYAGNLELAGINKIILTASGGPFLQATPEDLLRVTPDDACCHPNWLMGRKISVDSASMMNKGLEVIEAHWLFSAPPESIEVVVHPQSIIHSMVEYRDGSVMAQLGLPDMRTPIACALAWPERIQAGVGSLDFTSLSNLTFEAPDPVRFPCLKLAFDMLHLGGDAPAVMNAANEVAVDAFLHGRLRFIDIPVVVAETLEGVSLEGSDSIDSLLEKDTEARAVAAQRMAECSPC